MLVPVILLQRLLLCMALRTDMNGQLHNSQSNAVTQTNSYRHRHLQTDSVLPFMLFDFTHTCSWQSGSLECAWDHFYSGVNRNKTESHHAH